MSSRTDMDEESPRPSAYRPPLEKVDSAETAKGKVRRLSLAYQEVEEISRENKAARRQSVATSRASCASTRTMSHASAADVAAVHLENLEAMRERRTADDEPDINSKEDLKRWLDWAKAEAKQNLETEHPHILATQVERTKATWAFNNINNVVRGGVAAITTGSNDVEAGSSGGAAPNAATMGDEIALKQVQATPLPLYCDADDLSRCMGVGVRLYFDLLKLFFGFALIGIACAVPSFLASLANVHDGAYASEDPVDSLGVPGFIALITLGTRARELDPQRAFEDGCATDDCIALNNLTAVLEVLYSLLFFFAVRHFLRYANTLSFIDQEENVRVEDYSIELFGFDWLSESDATPRTVKAFVEGALKAHGEAYAAKYKARKEKYEGRKSRQFLAQMYARMEAKWRQFLGQQPFPGETHKAPAYKVKDVTMIVEDNGLLRKLVAITPAEARVPTLERQLEVAKATGVSEGGLRKIERRIAKAEALLERKIAAADTVAQKGFHPMGAFVTFERELCKKVALELWQPMSWTSRLLCCGFCSGQPGYAHFPVPSSAKGDGTFSRGYRLKSFPAPRPMNVFYENLCSKFAFSTLLRRGCANLVIILIIITGMLVTACASAVQSSAHYFADLLLADQLASLLNETSPGVAMNTTTVEALLASNATVNVTRNFFTCTPERNALITSYVDGERGDFFGTIGRLFNPDDPIHQGEGLQLGAALLSCYLVPVMNYLFSLTIVAFNAAISISIRVLVGFCRYDSRTDAHRTTVTRLSLAQFLNTGFILLVVNTSTGPIAELAGYAERSFGCWDRSNPTLGCWIGPNGFLLRGNHFDLGPSWYAEVGANFCFTLLLTLFMRPGLAVTYYFAHRLHIWWSANKRRHVEAMKKLYVGPVPLLPILLGQSYAFTALCIVFSTLMPILHVFLLVYVCIVYLTDKWYLLRVCKKPVPYSATFITRTLGWVQYALIAKLALAVWAFGSIPGTTLTDLLSELQSVLKDSDLTGSAGLIMNAQDYLSAAGEGWFAQRVSTVGSVILFTGLIILVVIVVLGGLWRALMRALGTQYQALCGKKKDNSGLWPDELPPFSEVLKGGATSHRVKVLRPADELGRGEKLAIKDDVDESRFANCHGPLAILLWLFGIATLRQKLTMAEWTDPNLEQKKNSIIGRQNMSYAPQFMPDYAGAFAYSKSGKDLAAATQRSRASTAAASTRLATSTASDDGVEVVSAGGSI